MPPRPPGPRPHHLPPTPHPPPIPPRAPARALPRTLGLALGLGLITTLALLFHPTPSSALDQPVVLAVYQGAPREGDFAANLASARTLASRALQQGAHFLVFPECFLSGYDSRKTVADGARSLDDPDLQEFVRETAAHDLVLVLGLARRDGTRLLDSAVVIHHGQVLGTYDKIHLTTDDRSVLGFQPGAGVPVFAAHGLRFGVLVGDDSAHLDAATIARAQGAELLFSLQYSEVAEPAADDHRRWSRNTHVGLASQFRVAVARANVTKTQRPGQVGYGDSFILGPQGEALAESRLFKPGLLTATLAPDMYRPPHVWGDFRDTPAWLGRQLARVADNFRPPGDDADLRAWLENMLVYHRFTPDEAAAATGLTTAEVHAEIKRLALDLRRRPLPGPGEPLKVLPYPGGRHPRLGFFDGAVAPQRETKVSVFTPWADGGYVVVDVPEAIFSQLGLLYLAHTHVPTRWDRTAPAPEPREWRQLDDGQLETSRTLPDGVEFRTRVMPGTDGVRFELSLRNGSDTNLTALRVQNCVMLGRAQGFEARTLGNKVFAPPFAAVRSADGRQWIITAWERCGRTWAGQWVPCLHSDPVLPDCPAGQTVAVRGWLSFHEGEDINAELERLKSLDPFRAPAQP